MSRKANIVAAPDRNGPLPLYRFTTLSHVDDRLVGPDQPPFAEENLAGDEAFCEDLPGPHMEPLNEAAYAMVAAHPPKEFMDPVSTMPLHTAPAPSKALSAGARK